MNLEKEIKNIVRGVVYEAVLDALTEHERRRGDQIEPLLTTTKVAELLGFERDEKGRMRGLTTVNQMIHSGRLKAHRRSVLVDGGGPWVVRRQDLIAYLDSLPDAEAA